MTLRIILFSIIESVVRLLFRYYKKAKFLITISKILKKPLVVYKEVKMYRRILVPLDSKGGPVEYVKHAAALASRVGAEISLLRIITVVPAEPGFAKYVQTEVGSSGAKRKAEAEEYVNQLTKQLQGEGVNVKPAVIISDKAEDEAIVEYAAELGSDLIVLPNQQRSLISRWLQGNVTAKVERRSEIPVLLVRDGEKGG